MEVFPVLHHILPGHDGGDGGGIGGGPANPLLLQGPDEGGLGVPGGGLGELLLRLCLPQGQGFPLLEVGQTGLDLAPLFVLALLIDGQEAGELHLRPAGPEGVPGTGDLNVHAVIDGRGHLAGQEPAPDELIEAILLLGQALPDVLRGKGHVGGADGLVGILGPCLGLKLPGRLRQILLAVPGPGKGPGRRHCLVRQAEGVGTHVGDETHGPLPLDVHAFVELLGDGHGPPGGHVQLPGGLLLEGGGDEGGRRGTVLVLALDLTHREGGGADGGQHLVHVLLGLELHLLLPAVKLGFEAALVGGHPVQGDL